MAVFLRFLNGKRQGEEFKVFGGVSLGRKRADINFKDPKVSAVHAKIEEESGILWLVDAASRNKLISQGETFERIEISDGLKVLIGDTEIEFFISNALDEVSSQALALCQLLQKNLENKPIYLKAFSQNLELEFIEGPDKGVKHFLSYGPRVAGKDSLDIFISDHFEKDTLFQIEDSEGKTVFKTPFPDLFLINDNSASSENVLDEEATIAFGLTKIKVKIHNDRNS